MTHLPLPLVPPISQFDGGALAAENCTMASTARLLRYGFAIKTTGSRLRACQSDQVGGTSIPDAARAVGKCHDKVIQWASPNDGVPVPAGRIGDFISPTRLRDLLDGHYMVLVQGDFDQILDPYRVGSVFMGDHAFTVDGRRFVRDRKTGFLREQAYVVDTQPKATSGYLGVWMPFSMLLNYAFKYAGNNRIYAAWTKPPELPDTGTEPDMPGLAITDFHVQPGTVQIENIVGVQAVQIADLERFNMAAGSMKEVIGWGVLAGDPLGKDTPELGDRHTVWVTANINGGPIEAAVILKSQAEMVKPAHLEP